MEVAGYSAEFLPAGSVLSALVSALCASDFGRIITSEQQALFWLFTLPFSQRQAGLEQQPYMEAALESRGPARGVKWFKLVCRQLPTKAGLEFLQSLESWCATSR